MSMSFETWMLKVISTLQWMEHFTNVGRVHLGDVFWERSFLAGLEPVDAVEKYLEETTDAEDVYGDRNATSGEREFDEGAPQDS